MVAEVAHEGVSRYARSQIHQTTVLDTVQVWVRAAVGRAVGEATGNSLAPEHLQHLVEDAARVARMRPPDPEFVSFAATEPAGTVAGYDEETAYLSATSRGDAIRTVVDRVAERGWTVSGTYLSA